MDETDEEIGKWIDFYEQIKTQGPPQEKSPDRRNLGSSSTKVDESDESEQEEPSDNETNFSIATSEGAQDDCRGYQWKKT